MRKCTFVVGCCALFVAAAQLWAADQAKPSGYHKPPKVITDVLESPATPTVLLSPTNDRMLVLAGRRHPTIDDLAQPMLRLAGHRINAATNGPHHPPRITGIEVLAIAGGSSNKVAVPANAYLGSPMWAPDGKHFTFTNTTLHSVDLWVADAATGAAHQITGVRINAAYGTPMQWLGDSRTVLLQLVPADRGAEPKAPAVPEGPIVQESYGKPAPVRTYEDLLSSPYDETLWDYYATSQLAFVNTATGAITKQGKPAVFSRVETSPDGMHVLVQRDVHPYSYLVPSGDFPKEVEIWSRTGQVERQVASLAMADQVPIEGVPTGPRSYAWRPNAPATLVWVEALDGGNTRKPAPFRDRIVMLPAPFSGEPVEIVQLQQRFQGGGFGGGFGAGARGNGIEWFERGGAAYVRDFERSKRWTRTFEINFDQPPADHTCPNATKIGEDSAKPGCRLIWSRSSQDRYNDPGSPVMHELPNGHRVIRQDGNTIYLTGLGASDQGDRPFLDRFDVESLKSERMFRCPEKVYEQPIAVLSADGSRFLTRFESPTDPPNYFIRKPGDDAKTQLTKFPDPAPTLRGISRQLVTYKRDDGVQLSFELYLPAGYKQGTPLPSIVWAYPLEFNDAFTAGQVTGSPYRFTVINGMSELWLLTQGYAILDNATMPVIGDPDTMNNTYVEQIVSSAKAAIDKAVEMGVTDRNRVGVGGHSYGAFMTANLLAHSTLFRAGVARSGAYNRTLTPFGFQSEQRTFWQAEDIYLKMSPFAFADKLKAPILLIHGMADDNSGTFPIQSERMYQALKGNGGNVRYVQLPYEAHGYQGLESVEHVLWEMITWFDKYVKNAPAGGPAPAVAAENK
jgi:dipeptidyl aminopeptidase/acylaminoacyl peptidase